MSHLFWGGFATLLVLAMFDHDRNADPAIGFEGAPNVASEDDDRESALVMQDDWSGGAVTLDRRPDGHFYARPLIGTTEIDTLVDTGASMIALTGDDARAIGLFWDDSQLQPVARGASGIVYGVPVTLERVELGGHVAHQVDAAIVPAGLPITLLGQSFLGRIDKVEIVNDRMVLGGV